MSIPLALGDIAVGGGYHYVDIMDTHGVPEQFIEQFDTIKRHMKWVLGETFAPSDPRDFYTALTPKKTQDYTPHDICAFPDGSGLLVAVVPSAGVLEFRKYEIGTDDPPTILQTWTDLKTDFNWAREQVRIDITCDSSTVLYTDSMRTIFQFDLVNGLQLDDYQVLPEDSPYVFGALRVLPRVVAARTHVGPAELGPVVVVARAGNGTGALHALCLDADLRTFWTDEVNPTGPYHAVKRHLSNGTVVLTVVDELDPDGANDEITALASYISQCAALRSGVMAFTTTVRARFPLRLI